MHERGIGVLEFSHCSCGERDRAVCDLAKIETLH